MSKVYWWVEKKDGSLAQCGRFIDEAGWVTESGMPQLQRTRKEAQLLCWTGERPVRVTITEVE